MNRAVLRLGSAIRIATGLCLAAAAPLAMAASLEINLKDQSGAALNDAVVTITRVNGQRLPVTPKNAEVDQVNEMFVPHVRAIAVGSSINFPNSDHTQHHVFSFSEAKPFDLPLYKEKPSSPVTFDKAGIVTLGCNIHDHMLGYIVVTDSPLFTEVSNGKAVIANVPAGQLAIEIWHPRLVGEKAVQKQLTVTAEQNAVLTDTLELRPERMVRRPAKRGNSRY